MSPAAVLMIDGPNALSALFDRSVRYRDVDIAPGLLPEAEAGVWRHRLAHDYGACGCGVGDVGGAIGVFAAAGYLFVARARLGDHLISTLAIAAAMVLVGAVAGKLIGLAVARTRLKRSVAQLTLMLQTPTP